MSTFPETRKAKGFYFLKVNKIEDFQDFEVKDILKVEPEYKPLPEYFLKWLEWLAIIIFIP